MSDFWIGYCVGFAVPFLVLALICAVATLYDYLWSLGNGQ